MLSILLKVESLSAYDFIFSQKRLQIVGRRLVEVREPDVHFVRLQLEGRIQRNAGEVGDASGIGRVFNKIFAQLKTSSNGVRQLGYRLVLK